MTDARIEALERKLQRIEEGIEARRRVQDGQHQQNTTRLRAMEITLIEIGVYLKVGRWVMNAVWLIAGSVGTALMMKWLGVKM